MCNTWNEINTILKHLVALDSQSKIFLASTQVFPVGIGSRPAVHLLKLEIGILILIYIRIYNAGTSFGPESGVMSNTDENWSQPNWLGSQCVWILVYNLVLNHKTNMKLQSGSFRHNSFSLFALILALDLVPGVW